MGFTSLRLLVWVWGGGGQLHGSGRGAVNVIEESRPSGISFSSPSVFVPPSAVNGWGGATSAHETKSGVSC